MAQITADRVRDTSTTTGTGNITVSGTAPTGFRTLSAVLSVNDTFYYAIQSQGLNEWEVGLGTYSSANVFARTTVLSSSNSGSGVNFSAGTKDVFLTLAAAKTIQADASGDVVVSGSVTSGTITSPSSTALTIKSAGTTAMTVDTSQRVGIGTTSPGALLETSSANANVYSAIRMTNTTGSGTTPGAAIEWAKDGTVKSSIQANTYGNDYMAFCVNGNTERVRIDSSGNVGIGSASPAGKLDILNGYLHVRSSAGDMSRMYLSNTNRTWSISNYGTTYGPNGALSFNDETAGAVRLQIDSSGNVYYNSGYGSAGLAYACRAWVSFSGSTIIGNGNVSSITVNGTGDYTVNFTTSMPDTNYSISGAGQCYSTGSANNDCAVVAYRNGGGYVNTGNVRIGTQQNSNTNGGGFNMGRTSIAVFR